MLLLTACGNTDPELQALFSQFAARNDSLQQWAQAVTIKLAGRSLSWLPEVAGELHDQYPVGKYLLEMKDIEDRIMSLRAKGIDVAEIDAFLVATEKFLEGFSRGMFESVKKNPSVVVVPGAQGLVLLISEEGYRDYLQ